MFRDVFATVVGNLGADPVLRETAGGRVVSFSIAHTRRVRDAASGEYVDSEPTWYRVSAFGSLAENAAESMRKGERVVVSGRMSSRTWTLEDGSTRTDQEITADTIGHDLMFGTTRFTKVVRAAQRTASADVPGDPFAESEAAPRPTAELVGAAPF